MVRHFKNENLHSVGNTRRLGVCQSTGEAKMRIFIQVLGHKIGCMPIFWGSKNENLHSGVWVRRLGVCQSFEELSLVGDKTKFNCYLVDLQAFTETCIAIWS